MRAPTCKHVCGDGDTLNKSYMHEWFAHRPCPRALLISSAWTSACARMLAMQTSAVANACASAGRWALIYFTQAAATVCARPFLCNNARGAKRAWRLMAARRQLKCRRPRKCPAKLLVHGRPPDTSKCGWRCHEKSLSAWRCHTPFQTMQWQRQCRPQGLVCRCVGPPAARSNWRSTCEPPAFAMARPAPAPEGRRAIFVRQLAAWREHAALPTAHEDAAEPSPRRPPSPFSLPLRLRLVHLRQEQHGARNLTGDRAASRFA